MKSARSQTFSLSRLVCAAALLGLAACAGQPAASSLSSAGKFAACPSAPHCVSSDDSDAEHQIAPLRIKGDASMAWAALKTELDKTPRTRFVDNRDDYRHVVVTTLLLRFKDDVEFHLRPQRNEIAMRSSSNVGYYDFNVNRNRLEAIRTALRQQGVVE